MKKLVLIVIIILGVVFLWRNCAEERAEDGCSPADIRQAIEAGQRDAMLVIESDSTGMERQNLILAIRARQHAIERAGFTVAADSYAVAAERVLRANGIID